MKNLLSIVIPCYNDWQFVAQSIESAINQTYQNKEIIVVDDGSDNRTKEVLKKLESKITRLITQENKGQSRARNVGISVARGDYILILDSDDFFAPEFAEKAVNVLDNNSKIKLVSCWVQRHYNEKKVDIFKQTIGGVEEFLRYNQAPGSAIFRKWDWQRVNGYDEQMNQGFEDWDFYIRLLADGGSNHIIEEPLFNYRIRNNSTTSRANLVKYELLYHLYIKHKALYKEHYDLLVSHLLSRISREESEKIKQTKRLEFRIGYIILAPLKLIKNFYK